LPLPGNDDDDGDNDNGNGNGDDDDDDDGNILLNKIYSVYVLHKYTDPANEVVEY
jgi:hypothetical protein